MRTSAVHPQGIDETELPCRSEDPELYFAESPTDVELAKAICQGCPVRAECLAWALEANQDHGVWGGLSEEERRSLRRRNARARVTAGV